jgi:hypothetical protein
MFHQAPRGCLFDFCSDKQGLSFNLRTADVCGDCMQVFPSVGIPDAILKQTVARMEGTRRLAINTGQLMEQEAASTTGLSPSPCRDTRSFRPPRANCVCMKLVAQLLSPHDERTSFSIFLPIITRTRVNRYVDMANSKEEKGLSKLPLKTSNEKCVDKCP